MEKLAEYAMDTRGKINTTPVDWGDEAEKLPVDASARRDETDSGTPGIFNEYVEKASEEFIESVKRLEETIRREENQAERALQDTEKKLLSHFQYLLSQATKQHEQSIMKSVKAYEEALRKVAQSFISAKENADKTYLETLRKTNQDLHRQIGEARMTRNADIDTCLRRARRC